jgi:anaerobic selenocysteine-containing dehydrogenase
MKIDRRSFLSFLIGGAAGTALSPLPWKLTDDISIWTQMWPWTPVPQRGENTYVKSACTLCPGGCGIHVRKVGERVVKIEGLPDHPVNDGGLCLLGLSGANLLYGHRRVRAPLKKVNGRFRQIRWDDAIAELAQTLTTLRDSGHPYKLACLSGSDRGTVAQLLARFLTVYGSPNFVRTATMQDTYEQTLYLMQGDRATAGFDAMNSDYVLSFGSGVLHGWGPPVFMFQAHSRWQKEGGKLVQCEPRLSSTSAMANQWVAIKPGTEGTLALGVAHVIIKEGLYNADFVDQYTNGFDAWRRQVLDGFRPDIVAEITGVDANTLSTVAREFARARRPLAVCGRGKGLEPGSLKEFMAVHALNALVGSVGRQGGIWAVPEPEYIDWAEPEMDAVASQGMQKERIDQAGSGRYPFTRYLPDRLSEVMADPARPVEVLFVHESNPAYSLPGVRRMLEAMQNVPMVVSFSSYMDETAQAADLILPNHIYLERYEDLPVTAGYPQPLVNLVRPVVRPQFNTRHTGDVILKLAQAMGGTVADAFPWEDYQRCLEMTLADIWDSLDEDGYWIDADFAPSLDDENAFATASGKFEFVNPDVESMTLFTPVKAEGDEAAFPLVLIPYDSMRLWAGYIAATPFVVKTVSDTVLKGNDVLVEIHPDTAKQIGLKQNSEATLSTPEGQARVRVNLYEGIAPGLVAMVRGLGHTAHDPFIAGKGVNVNTLLPATADTTTGLNAAWGIRAKLTRA